MRTTLDIDPKLLEDAVEATGEKSKSKAVQKILEEFIRRKAIDEIRAMAGEFQIEDTSEETIAAEARRQAILDDIGRS